MDVFLFGLDLEGDNDDYAEMLIKAGYRTTDELFSKSPTLEQLVSAGISDVEDAKKVRKALLSRKPPGGGVGGGALHDLGIEGIDLGSAASRPHAVPVEHDEPVVGGASIDEILQQYTGLSSTVSLFDRPQFVAAKALIENGNAPALKKAIEDMDVNMQDPEDGNTLMHWAVAHNRKEISEYLLARGAKQELNLMSKTPLELAHDAVQHGDSSYIPLRNFLYARFSGQQ